MTFPLHPVITLFPDNNIAFIPGRLLMHTPSPDSASGTSLVIGRRFLERLPLLAIMAEDDQRHMLALDQIQELSRACT